MGTPTLTRPLKVGNVRTYVEEAQSLAPADAPILAPEVDADLKVLYDAWNDPASAFPPTGPVPAGDLGGSTYPSPVVAPGAITRAKIAADAWLNPAPGGGDVGKVLAVASGPALAYVAPPGGPPTGAAGGDLAGSSYPNPVIAAGAVTAAKLAAGVIPTALPPNGAAGGDLAGSTYPNPVIAAGKITKAKLATDVSNTIATDLGTPSIGASSANFLTLLDFGSSTPIAARLYRLSVGGWFNKAVACDLYLSFNAGNVNVFLGNLSPSSIAVDVSYFVAQCLFLYSGGGSPQTYAWTTAQVSPVASGATATVVARSLAKAAAFTGASAFGPQVLIQFTVANASNQITRYQSALELL